MARQLALDADPAIGLGVLVSEEASGNRIPRFGRRVSKLAPVALAGGHVIDGADFDARSPAAGNSLQLSSEKRVQAYLIKPNDGSTHRVVGSTVALDARHTRVPAPLDGADVRSIFLSSGLAPPLPEGDRSS